MDIKNLFALGGLQARSSVLPIMFAALLVIQSHDTVSQQSSESYSTDFSPAAMVYPLLDAANSRWFFFNSATMPFGMVNLSPDMGVGGAWESGYRYNKERICFFSHIHAWQLSGIPVMPVTGEFKGHKGPDTYSSAYGHDKEEVGAGYHSIYLEDYDIVAELTATTRVGFHRYSFPAKAEKYILLDLGTLLGPGGTKSGYAKQIGKKNSFMLSS